MKTKSKNIYNLNNRKKTTKTRSHTLKLCWQIFTFIELSQHNDQNDLNRFSLSFFFLFVPHLLFKTLKTRFQYMRVCI